MSQEVNTPAPTAEEVFAHFQQKLASELAAPLIIDRLINHHGLPVTTEAEAERIVKSAFHLFDLHHAGKLNLPPEEPVEETELQKSAAAIDALYREVVTNDNRYHDLFNNPEVQNAAAQMATLLSNDA